MTTEIKIIPDDSALERESESAMADITKLLTSSNPNDPNDPGPLFYSWRFLQVYSTWGLKMPHTEAHLTARLGMKNPGEFTFLPLMLEAYGGINKACSLFQTEAFPEIVKVGRSLLDFASEASPKDSNLFGLLIELLDKPDTSEALELIQDLQQTVRVNLDRAEIAGEKLNAFSAALTTANGQLQQCDALIEADASTSQASIDQMKGGPDVKGSLLNLKKLLDEKQAEYDHNVVVASTSVAYAWVWLIGFIVGPIVAGIYGDRAVKALEEVHRQTKNLEAENIKLFTAIQTHQSQELARTSVGKAMSYTELALTHNTVVRNAWSGIAGCLTFIDQKVHQMTSETSEETKLKAKALVKNYATAAGKRWDEMIPPLKALTTNPYITGGNDAEKPLDILVKDVEKDAGKPVEELVGAGR